MQTSQVLQVLEFASNTKTPTLIWGKVGVGKNALVKQFAHSQDYSLSHFVHVMATHVLKAATLHSVLPRDGNGIIFIDEFPSASDEAKDVILSLVQNGRLDDYVLPAGWQIIAAGNESDRGNIPVPLRSHFLEITFDPQAAPKA